MSSRTWQLHSVFGSLALALIVLAAWGAAPARSASATVLITAVYYDTYADGQLDEAFRLQNVSSATVDLAGWTITDGQYEGTITLQGSLAPGESLWIARQAVDFALEFGFSPAYEYQSDTDPAVPDLTMSGSVALADDGDQLLLKNGEALVDSVVWEDGDTEDAGWSGPTVEPYGPTTAFAREGQVLYRMLDQSTGQPVADTDTAADWAQAMDDGINGKKVQYPGWDLEEFFFPETFTETATLTYAIAPDNIYDAVLSQINQATTSIYYEGYTFKNAHLADAIVARMTGYEFPAPTVRILLEGEPVGGITDQEKWICQQIEEAGGEVYFMYNDSAGGVHDRYTYQHGKWMVIDGDTLLTGSENLNYSSMPADDKADGTEGNRGVWLITDAPGAVAHAMDVFEHDLDPENHKDLFRWTASDPTYGAPAPGFAPDYNSGGTSYPVQFPTPLTMAGTFSFEMVQSPETSLRDSDSLLGMVARAGSGDRVLVEQLYEYTFWGPTTSNPAGDPNPRLEAYIDAARRGAGVRI
ncbi:MAG: lamin tail domain-containing protein, partial [Anaerolineae bacterium]